MTAPDLRGYPGSLFSIKSSHNKELYGTRQLNGKAMRKAYPSDLTDDQWAVLALLIPPAKHGGAPRTVDIREVLNTLFYQNRSGCQWDMLPHDLLPKNTA